MEETKKNTTEQEIQIAAAELSSLTSLIDSIKKIGGEVHSLKDTTIQNISNLQNEFTAEKDKASEIIANLQREVSTLKDAATQTINASKDEVAVAKDAATKNINNSQIEVNTLKDTTAKDIANIHSEVKVIKDSGNTIVNDFKEKQRISTENEKKIIEFLTKIEGHKVAVETIQNNSTQWQEDISKTKKEIADRSKEYEELNTKSKTTQNEIQAGYETIFGKKAETGEITKGYLQNIEELKEQINAFLKDQEKKYTAQFDHIESLLPGATSAGLAESYQKQKESYKWSIRLWSAVFIVDIVFMTWFSLYLFFGQFLALKTGVGSDDLTKALISLLKDLPFYIPTIWLAVFASKQQSQLKRLQQEYAFKEINAKSFFGYKKQIEELMKEGIAEKELLLKLVAQLVVITSQNPSDTLDNKSHEDSPPIFKLVEKFLPHKKDKAEKD